MVLTMKAKTVLWIGLILLSVKSMAQEMPRLFLDYDTLASDTFYLSHMQLVQDSDTLSLPILLRRRGHSALYMDKPSYAIKILDSVGAKQDTSLLGMRSDNYWILDAMAVDHARMRNRVSMDLWLEFSRQPWYKAQEPKMLNGYRGQMVEVLVNDSTQGIYHLSERVDRKQLKLKKYSAKKGVQGLLYKSEYNYRTVYYNLWNTPSNTSVTWDGWEQQYPDAEDGEPIAWDALYHHIDVLTHTYGSSFVDTAQAHLDIPVYVDYILFVQLLCARDNKCKNLFVSFYNAGSQQALYTPWDLDHSWGRQYNGDLEASNTTVEWTENYLYRRMQYYYHLQDTLAARYAQLRQYYFTIEHIDSLFAPYFDLYAITGMDSVEQRLWSGHNRIDLDIPSEQMYIHDWVIDRLAYMDNLYDYTPSTPTDIDPVSSQDGVLTLPVKTLHQGRMMIHRGVSTYDMMGQRVSESMHHPR